MSLEAASLSMSSSPNQGDSAPSKSPGFRVGVFGCGPRGLYCLQSLADQLIDLDLPTPVIVEVFEPTEFPGAGNIYDPRQPDYLIMNYAAKHIDAWPPRGGADPTRPNLVEWLRQRRGISDPQHSFPPRAWVGEYLNECFQQVMKQLRRRATVIQHRVRVDEVLWDGGWQVVAAGDTHRFDRVVLTVGHEGWRRRESGSAVRVSRSETDLPAETSVFPVSEQLSQTRVPAASDVAVRGFGLTWIDAALALTEGRGGVFEERSTGFCYLPSGLEPRALLPFSRSGRPMLAKPDGERCTAPPEIEQIWTQGGHSIDQLKRPLDRAVLLGRLWGEVVECAATAVNLVDTSRVSATDVHAWFRDWTSRPADPQSALDAIRHSHAVACGDATPDIAWALGEAWRGLYPSIVRCVSHGGLTRDAWPSFRRIASEMERIAFGPPATNVAKILALVDAGLIDFAWLNSELDCSPSQAVLTRADASHSIDVLVNAVLPGATDQDPMGPVQQLLSSGMIQRDRDTGGVRVKCSGSVLVSRSRGREGVAVIGRVTEGCVLGNDTLSRTLHQQPDRWAEEIARMLANEGVKP